jgi:hypothetical protein
MNTGEQGQRLFDGVAIGASVACLVHCLLLPVLIVLLPTLAVSLAVPEEVHLWALAFAGPTSAVALVTGYCRHRRIKPATIAVPGLALLAVGALMAPTESAETMLSVAGALLLGLGHGLNWSALRAIGASTKQ